MRVGLQSATNSTTVMTTTQSYHYLNRLTDIVSADASEVTLDADHYGRRVC